MWGGHSCPPPLTLVFDFGLAKLKWISTDTLLKVKINFSGDGQECPSPTCEAT